MDVKCILRACVNELQVSYMKPITLTIIISVFAISIRGQNSFSNIDIDLRIIKKTNSIELICSNPLTSINFEVYRNVIALNHKNFVSIDNQTIQIVLFKTNSENINFKNLNSNEQKAILENYSKYELEYFKSNLNVELINPNNQWVISKSRGWFIWYFRVGNLSQQLENKTEIQLFATTIIVDEILVLNAPIIVNNDFKKAALIVNELMESLNYIKK